MAQYRCKRRTMLPDGRLAKVGEIYDLKEAPPSDYTWEDFPTQNEEKQMSKCDQCIACRPSGKKAKLTGRKDVKSRKAALAAASQEEATPENVVTEDIAVNEACEVTTETNA